LIRRLGLSGRLPRKKINASSKWMPTPTRVPMAEVKGVLVDEAERIAGITVISDNMETIRIIATIR
jgi:hypothetical protein